MKKIILIFILIINSNSFAAEFKLDTSGTSEIEGITFNDSSKFRLYKSKGYWKASSGDYGTVKCFGTLKNNKDNLDKKLLPNIPKTLMMARLPQVKIKS